MGTFLKIGDLTFIEFAYEPFKKWSRLIDEVIFICTEEQDKKFSVEKEIINLIEHPNVSVVKIKEKTRGPHQTLAKGLNKVEKNNSIIVCDCDHSIDVDPIFNLIVSNSNYDCIIPIWDIDKSEYKNWSKVVIDEAKMQPKMICEKQRVESDYGVFGIIGCVYFKENIFEYSKEKIYVSDALNDLLFSASSFGFARPKKTYFYGDLDMFEKCVEERRKECSIFCDIDGTLVEHKDHSDCDVATTKKLNHAETLNKWKNDGHKIILTTARNEKFRDKLVSFLDKLNIRYDSLIMGLPSGPRFLINDRKPSKIFATQANAIELKRNEGLVGVDIEKIIKNNDIEVIEVLKGNSFAMTYLVSYKNKKFVRKVVKKEQNSKVHYDKLKRQIQDLQRLDFVLPGSVPKVINVEDNHYELYYDMEYLENYKKLVEYPTNTVKKTLNIVLNKMNKNVYSFKKEVEGMSWVANHMKIKIYPKLKKYSEDDKTMEWLINSEFITINEKKYFGLSRLLREVDLQKIKPRYIRPVHGDMTLENILFSEEKNDFKLIDMDASDHFDAVELDLGKLCQSILSKYELWSNDEHIISEINDKKKYINVKEEYFSYELEDIKYLFDLWYDILNEDRISVFKKGVFYMCMYFIRFVPFRMAISREHGIFALIMAIRWLHNIIGDEDVKN
jgi:hypothetical protein